MRIYGPVPSRRFGLSLGVDIVPHKTCPFDCIYCQLGETDELSTKLENFYKIDDIICDVKTALKDDPLPDVITLAGSGDPTLYRDLDILIDRLKAETSIPILLITNAALFWNEDVAKAALKADILAPSLDAGDEKTFNIVNKPHKEITFARLVDGLQKVTHAHKGEVRLEIMLIKDVNDSEQSIRNIAKIVKTLRFDRIDLNTPVRPPVPQRGALPCDEDVLKLAQTILGEKAHPIGTFQKKSSASNNSSSSNNRSFEDKDKDIREMLFRRPCTVKDICDSLGFHSHEVIKITHRLQKAGLLELRTSNNETYFHVVGSSLTNEK